MDRRAFLGTLALFSAPRGGRTYDAIIAECAGRARCATLLTFNISHFMPLAGAGLEIVMPGHRRGRWRR